MCQRLPQQVCRHQSALVFPAVCLRRAQPQQVSVLPQQLFTPHIQAQAQVPQHPLH